MKNLGKILLLFILQNSLWAGVVASVDSTSVTRGDMVTYTISMSGEDIKKPIIDSLCGSDIISTGSSTSIKSINGNMKRSYELSYQFIPTKSCVIEPVEVGIDSKKFKTKEIKIDLKEVTNSNDKDFILSLESNKKDLYVGEEFELTLLLKQKNRVRFVDSRFVAPKFNGFWIKKEFKPQKFQEGEYVITKIVYKLAPQRESLQTIKPALLKIAKRVKGRDMFGFMSQNVKWKNYLSNELKLDIKPIPNALKLIGNFKIDVEFDSDEVKLNEPFNLTIKVNGKGNLEDIESFKPYIKDVNIFDEKVVVKDSLLTQKIAFLSESNFTIPPFELKFFNLDTNKTETISTKEINVKVKNAKPKEELVIKREIVKSEPKIVVNVTKNSYFELSIFFILGTIFGVILMLLSPWNYFKKDIKSVNLKNPKILLIKLLPYKDNDDVKEIIEMIESNFYGDKRDTLDKKKLKAIVKKYNRLLA